MTDIVECVARMLALYQRWGPTVDNDSQLRMRERVWLEDWPDEDIKWSHESGAEEVDRGRDYYRDFARAAIKAIFPNAKQRECEVCGSQILSGNGTGRRSTARFCTDRCRKRAHREKIIS